VFDALARLADKSLVVDDRTRGWYRLLETLRLYAIELLAARGEVAPAAAILRSIETIRNQRLSSHLAADHQ
jgi:predicted ATPase